MTSPRSQAARLTAVVSMAVVALLPAWAWACPACANRGDEGALASVYFLGAMILLPFGIAAAVVKVIQRLPDDSPETLPTETKMESSR